MAQPARRGCGAKPSCAVEGSASEGAQARRVPPASWLEREADVRDRVAELAVDGEGRPGELFERDAWFGEALRELEPTGLQPEPPVIEPDFGMDFGP